MILLLLGTNPYPFNRLLYAVNEWSENNNVHVIAQTGHTESDNVSIDCYKFVDHAQILKWIDLAEFVITQGGFGGIKDCLSLDRKVLAVPRQIEFGECADDQNELVEALREQGKIMVLNNVELLEESIIKLNQFSPALSTSTGLSSSLAGLLDDYASE